MCMIDDSEGAVHIFGDQQRTARKSHVCQECWRTIAKNERYFFATGVGEDGFFSSKTCQHCKIAQEWLTRECGGFLFQGVEDDIFEHIAEAGYRTPLSLAKIAVGMRRKWQRFYTDTIMPIPKMPGEMRAYK